MAAVDSQLSCLRLASPPCCLHALALAALRLSCVAASAFGRVSGGNWQWLPTCVYAATHLLLPIVPFIPSTVCPPRLTMDNLDSHQGQPRQLDDGLASLFQGSHASSSSSAASSHSLLLSLSQTLHGLQAHPSESIPELQEEILPLLALPAPDGVSALLPIWKGAFEGKASEPTGYTSNEEVRTNVQIALASARLLRNVVGGCEPLQNLVFERTAGEILALLRLGSSLAFVSDPEREYLVI